MGERRGTKALELWCRRITEGYPGVKVDNMTTSWRDGLAFCALIHHFRPDLIDFSSLKKEDVYHNNELAFRTAESYLGIPALLDAEDMAQYAVPDRLSILTYLSQYYQHFASAGSPHRISGKRSSTSTEHSPLPPSPSSSSPPTKMMSSGLGRREPCVSCGQPVFLAQRLLVEKRLFHRTCFACARCGTQLTLASYHHRPTDPEGRYCCETCPDEETDSQGDDTNSEDPDTTSNQSHDNVSTSEYNQILSDEEKVRNIQQFKDALAAERLAFEENLEKKMALTSGSSKALSGFLNSQFEEETPPAVPTSSPPAVVSVVHQESTVTAIGARSSPTESVSKLSEDNVKYSDLTMNSEHSNINSDSNKLLCSVNNDLNNSESQRPIPLERKSKHLSNIAISPTPATRVLVSNVHDNSTDNDNVNQPVTASDFRESVLQSNPCEDNEVSAKDDKIIAKDKMRYETSDSFVRNKQDIDTEISQASLGPSLVKSRMKLFEQVDTGSDQDSHNDNKVDQNTLIISSAKINDNKKIENNYTSNVSDKLSNNTSVIDVVKEEQSIKQHDSLNELKTQDTEASTATSRIESQKLEENKVPVINYDVAYNNDDSSTTVLSNKTQDNISNNCQNNTKSEELLEPVITDDHIIEINKELTSDNDVCRVERINESVGEKIEDDIETTPDRDSEIHENQLTTNVETINAIETSEVEVCEHPVTNNESPDEKKEFKSETFNNEGEDKNPFGDEDDDDTANVDNLKDFQITDESHNSSKNESDMNVSALTVASENSAIRKKNTHEDELYPEELNPFCSDEEKEVDTPVIKTSTNPFGSCSEDEDDSVKKGEGRRKSGEKPPRPPPPAIMVHAAVNKQNHNLSDQKKKIIPAPNLNPFGSDDESEDEDQKHNMTTPTPATRMNDAPPSFYGSASSLVGTQRRKKAPAPRPPTQQLFTSPPQDGPTSINSLISTPSSLASPQLSPRSRKRRPAPPPPTTSSPLSAAAPHHLMATSSPIVAAIPASPSPKLEHSRSSSVASHKKVISAADFDEQDLDLTSSGDWVAVGGELDKSNTSQLSSQHNIDQVSITSHDASINKSAISPISRHRKGPAPAIPRIGSRGPVSAGALRRELALLEEQQRGLERQGVRLETLIRERTEDKEPPPEGTTDVETDELLLQLFDLVNEKNELFRRQAELMYLRKQQRLEEEQADLEQQVRVLMSVEESNKTDADKQREETLLGRLVDVVHRRDLVVAALDQERLREKAEDQAVRERMTLHRAKLEELSSLSSADTQLTDKKEKKKKKHWMKRDKGKKGEGGGGKEETESANTKKVKHKKWFK